MLILIDYHKNDIVKRKQLLRKLNQGAAYRYMVNNVFPKLRRSEITIVREIPEVAKKPLNRYLLSPSCWFQDRKRRFRIVSLISLWEKV